MFHLDVPVAATMFPGDERVATETERPRGYGLFGTKVLLVEDEPDVLECDDDAAGALAMHGAHRDLHRRGAAGARATRPGFPTSSSPTSTWTAATWAASPSPRCGDYLGRDVPALIITGDTSEAVTQTARAAGVELMRKPLKPAQLRALLAHLLA